MEFKFNLFPAYYWLCSESQDAKYLDSVLCHHVAHPSGQGQLFEFLDALLPCLVSHLKYMNVILNGERASTPLLIHLFTKAIPEFRAE